MDIQINDDEINVKDIMRQIKENLGIRDFKNDLLSTHSQSEKGYSLTELEANVYNLNKSWHYAADTHISSHRRGIGEFIVFGKKVMRKLLRWYINPIVEKQTEFNSSLVRTFNMTVDELKKMNSINSDLLEEINKLKQRNEGTEHLIKHLQAENESLNKNVRIGNERMRRIESWRNLSKQEVTLKQPPVEQRQHEQNTGTYEFDYYLFEEQYRGSREEIIGRQTQYLKYFENAEHVLDLGCGRGEFTEILLDKGLKVTSVDMDDDMVAYCAERGFNIVKSDILAFLETVEDNSVDGIFLGQVIEHMSSEQFIYLVNLSHQKLKPAGWFIAETPNPQCLSIFAQSFYMDPTHVKPVHAYTAKFILETAGFTDLEVNYISPNDAHLRLPELKLEGHHDNQSLQQFNEAIVNWNNVIFGYQDYYVAGRK